MDKFTPTLETVFAMQEACQEGLYDDNVREAVVDVLQNYQEVDVEQLTVMLFNVCANVSASVGSALATTLFDTNKLDEIILGLNEADEQAVDTELQHLIENFHE